MSALDPWQFEQCIIHIVRPYIVQQQVHVDGDMSINIVNLQFVTDIGSNNAGGFGTTTAGASLTYLLVVS